MNTLILKDGNVAYIVTDWVYNFYPQVYYHYHRFDCKIFKLVRSRNRYGYYTIVHRPKEDAWDYF